MYQWQADLLAQETRKIDGHAAPRGAPLIPSDQIERLIN
jgi:hypothetical protein